MMNTRTKKTIHQCFNPYFNGSSTSTFPSCVPLVTQIYVSILILMDLVLLLQALSVLLLLYHRFNPYFNGSSTSTISEDEIKELTKEFQSLF